MSINFIPWVTDVKMILYTNLAPRSSFLKSAKLCELQFLSYCITVKWRIIVKIRHFEIFLKSIQIWIFELLRLREPRNFVKSRFNCTVLQKQSLKSNVVLFEFSDTTFQYKLRLLVFKYVILFSRKYQSHGMKWNNLLKDGAQNYLFFEACLSDFLIGIILAEGNFFVAVDDFWLAETDFA